MTQPLPRDERLTRLQHWLEADLGIQAYQIAPASADASFRRYFRINWDGQSRIVMDAPPAKEDIASFTGIAAVLKQLGLNVPVVLEQDTVNGFLLLTDLGSRDYLSALNDGNAETLYTAAIEALRKLQACPVPASYPFPPYDRTLLMNEMGLFRDWYLARHLGVDLSAAQQTMLEEVFDLLAESALAQPRVLVHRDYHSRNLMVCEPNPGILDFQDAVIGPVTYDLVSLLRDCYIAWPRHRVEQWVRQFYEAIRTRGELVDTDFTTFLTWFDLMGVQRHLKASGIFARLNYRDGKPGYLPDIPRTLGYVKEVAGRHPALHAFGGFLAELEAHGARYQDVPQ